MFSMFAFDALFKKNNTVETLLHENLGGAFSPPAAHKIPDLPICRCRAHGAVTLRRATPTTAWRRHRAPTPLHVSSASSPEAKRVRRSMNERPASRRAQSRTLVQSERELGRRPTTQCSTFLRSEVLFLTPFETLGNLVQHCEMFTDALRTGVGGIDTTGYRDTSDHQSFS